MEGTSSSLNSHPSIDQDVSLHSNEFFQPSPVHQDVGSSTPSGPAVKIPPLTINIPKRRSVESLNNAVPRSNCRQLRRKSGSTNSGTNSSGLLQIAPHIVKRQAVSVSGLNHNNPSIDPSQIGTNDSSEPTAKRPSLNPSGLDVSLPISTIPAVVPQSNSFEMPLYMDLLNYLVNIHFITPGRLFYSSSFAHIEKVIYNLPVAKKSIELVPKLVEAIRKSTDPTNYIEASTSRTMKYGGEYIEAERRRIIRGMNFYNQFFDILCCIFDGVSNSSQIILNKKLEMPSGSIRITKEARDNYFAKERKRIECYQSITEELSNLKISDIFQNGVTSILVILKIYNKLQRMGPPQRPIQHTSLSCKCTSQCVVTIEFPGQLPEKQPTGSIVPSGLPVIDLPVVKLEQDGQLSLEERDFVKLYEVNRTFPTTVRKEKAVLKTYVDRRCYHAARMHLKGSVWDIPEIPITFDYFDAILEHFDMRSKRFFDNASSISSRHIFYHTDKVYDILNSTQLKKMGQEERKWKLSPLIVNEIECVFRHLYRINLNLYFANLNANWDTISYKRHCAFTNVIKSCWSSSTYVNADSEELDILSTLCAILFDEGCHTLFRYLKHDCRIKYKRYIGRGKNGKFKCGLLKY